MKKHRNNFQYLLLTACAALLCWAYSTGGAAMKRQTSLAPKVVSKVKLIEVVSATVDSDPAVLYIALRNNSDKAVVSVAVESGDKKDASGINFSGFRTNNEPPMTLIEPHATKTFKIQLDNLLPNKPIKVGGVIYADGTEDGDEDTLGTMHRNRQHDESRPPTKKGGEKQ